MERQSYTIELSADKDGLRHLYDFMSDVSVFFDLDEKTRFEIELATEEAITNIIDHAYQGKGGTIVLTITYFNDEIRIILQDWGVPISADKLPQAYDYSLPVHERIKGGMGLHFIRTLMDSVRFDSTDNTGTILTMSKHYVAANPSKVRDELEVFDEVGRALSTAENVNSLLDLIVTKLTQAVNADRATLYLVDADTDTIYSKILQQTDDLKEIRLKIGQGIAGHVAKTGETVNIRSVQEDPHFAAQFDAKSGYQTRNMICTPMRNAKNQIIGVIQLLNKKKGHFTRRDESILRVLASQAAIAYENARLIESEQSKRQLADTLREVAAIINSSFDLDQVLALVLEQLERVISFHNASILMTEGEYFVVAASRGHNAADLLKQPVFRVEDSRIFADLVKASTIIIPDIHQDERWLMLDATADMHSWLGTLLRTTDGQIIGELGVMHSEGDFYTQDEVTILTTFANQASAAIERARLYEQSLEQVRLRQEIETAVRIQTSLLPDTAPKLRGWQVAASWHPALEVGGDFYDFIELGDHRIGFVIADVSGKGVPAALFMAMTRTIFRTLAMNNASVEHILSQVNEAIYQDNRARLFVTLFYGVLDTQTGLFEGASGGHNPPLVFRHQDESHLFWEASGVAIGVFPDIGYEKQTVVLQSGDILVMYTDGITECINADEEEFDETRLLEIIVQNHHLSAQEIALQINRGIQKYAGDLPPHDDATVIVIKRG